MAQLVPSTHRRPGKVLLAPSSRIPRLLVVASTFPARRGEGTPGGFVWDLADGAILENLRARPLRWLQVPPFLVGEAIALRHLIAEFDPDVLHVHWVLPQGLVAASPRPAGGGC